MISTVSFNEYVDVVAHRTSQSKKVVKLVMTAYLAYVARELEENGSAGVLGLFDVMDKTKVPSAQDIRTVPFAAQVSSEKFREILENLSPDFEVLVLPKFPVALSVLTQFRQVVQVQIKQGNAVTLLKVGNVRVSESGSLQVRKAASLGQGVSLVPKTFFKSLVKG